MEVTDMIIRPAVPADLPQLQQLYQDTVEAVCRNDYDAAQRAAWAALVRNDARMLARIAEQHFLIAEIAGSMAGFASLAGDGYLDLMYVHKDHQRRGVAQALFGRLEAQARATAAQQMSADVSKTALPFFLRNGFRTVHENRNLIEGLEIINYRMEKNLAGFT